jgi:hypothetical protein
MAALRAEMDTSRLTRMTSNAHNLAEAGHLRDDITAEHAGEVLWTYSSPELYELLVLGRGWPAERYATFIADAMIAALLPPEPPLAQQARHNDRRSTPRGPDANAGLGPASNA